MPKLPFFVTSCPACSRKNQLEIRWLGQQTDCIACGKSFHAKGPDSSSAALEDPLHYWINFTEHSFPDPEQFGSEPKDIARTPR